MLTPTGSAAIAVVRLAGAGTARFLAAHFSKVPAPSRCVHGELRDGDTVIDDPLVILCDDSRSAEIHLHGGPWVLASALNLLRRERFNVIESQPNPLPVENVAGRTLLEREILAYLPLARTEQGIRLLLGQQDAWQEFLRHPTAAEKQDAIGDLRPMLFPPRVAIVGAPNVGKSTLANRLFAQQRSITADLPGTTRDWVGAIANLDGLPVMLIDTPGLRRTDDSIESVAIDRSREVIRRADLVIEVIDASVPSSRAWPGALVVLNKVDRAVQSEPAIRIRTVGTTGEGIHTLRTAIRAHFGFASTEPSRPMVWTQRHRDLLLRARDNPSLLREMLG